MCVDARGNGCLATIVDTNGYPTLTFVSNVEDEQVTCPALVDPSRIKKLLGCVTTTE